MEEVARGAVRYLYDDIIAAPGEARAFPLVRLFKTHRAGDLGDDLRRVAEARATEPVSDDTPCLALLATAGDEIAWNSRASSAAHRAMPLTSESMIAQAPMVHRLFTQFGVPLSAVVTSDFDLLVDVQHRSFRVFHVEQALGSPWIPAQEEFVVRYGIQSVLGFGGVLAGGSLFAVLLFSRVTISSSLAELFGSLALNLKIALQTFGDDEVFVKDV